MTRAATESRGAGPLDSLLEAWQTGEADGDGGAPGIT